MLAYPESFRRSMTDALPIELRPKPDGTRTRNPLFQITGYYRPGLPQPCRYPVINSGPGMLAVPEKLYLSELPVEAGRDSNPRPFNLQLITGTNRPGPLWMTGIFNSEVSRSWRAESDVRIRTAFPKDFSN